MTFDEYQKQAEETDRVSQARGLSLHDAIIVPLLGLAGEAGELLTEYKKQMRDGASHTLHSERVSEELGDLLWYIANLASKYGLSMDAVAKQNLRKTQNRWNKQEELLPFVGLPLPHEAFPVRFEATIVGDTIDGKKVSNFLIDGQQIGATLTDNSHDSDGYRFHDVFHLTYAAMLGWSPVTRALLKRKRRSDPRLDEVEDGGRAVVIEEGIAALVFAYARDHAWLKGVKEVDYDLLRTIKKMTAHLEVSDRTSAEWEQAILRSFELWRFTVEHDGGRFVIEPMAKTIRLQHET